MKTSVHTFFFVPYMHMKICVKTSMKVKMYILCICIYVYTYFSIFIDTNVQIFKRRYIYI